ncbi:hypothetical protein V6N13_060245 [Hibiscus sabdariffa]
MQWEAREGAISLFVENLPERLHWKILWFAFARRGEVVNVYIARRRSRGDKRFRFVMMKNLEEADRVTQRFNGTTLYGLRLVVKIARDNQGHDWKRNTRESCIFMGVFEALAENAKRSLDCEKATVLISTNQVKRIEEVIEVEIGDRVFQVGVEEIGFNDGTSYPLCNQWKKKAMSCEKSDEPVSESVNDLKSDSEQK